MPIATSVFKKLYYKRQTGLGVKATAASAKEMRRVTSSLDLGKGTYKSNEVQSSQQTRDFRHGVKTTDGKLSCELSSGTFQAFFESLLRNTVATGGTTTAVTTVTAADTSAGSAIKTGTFTRTAGSWITDGHKIGDIVRFTGWTAPAVANNAHNFLITALTATVMTVLAIDGVAVAAKAAGDSVSCALQGKKVFVPTTGHTRDYYTFEHWYADVGQSEQFTDVVIASAALKLPPSGMATCEFALMGIDMQTSVSQYFTSPSAPTTTPTKAAANGALVINGAVVGLLTGLDVTINGNYNKQGGVVGSNLEPDIFPGVVEVSGQATILFKDATYRDMFVNETEASIIAVLTSAPTPNADFLGITMSRVKFGGASKEDSNTGLTQTMPFTALENISGSTVDMATTITIQDSQFA